MKKYIQGMNGKASYSVLRTYDVLRTLIIVFFAVFTSVNAFADGWTPTDGGLVVNLKPTDQILLSVPVDTTGDGVADVEFFVENYARFSGGYFKYSEKDTNKYFLRLVPLEDSVTVAPEMAIWSIDTALAHVNGKKDVLGGIAYTMWNDSRTLKTQNNFRFYGELTEKGDAGKKDGQACDMVFVIPTNHEGITSFDPNKTLGRATQDAEGRFNGLTGYNEQLGMYYREVYWLDIPRNNFPRTYTNAALVTFNTTKKDIKFSNNEATAKSGRAYYAYADDKHKPTKRTLFRLYILNDPITSSPDSYFFAYDEQDSVKYRQSNSLTDLTGWKKIYTMDRLFPMQPEKAPSTLQKTNWMYVPVPDNSYYYVGWHDDYRIGSETLGSTATAKSQFTKIRELPMKDAPALKAPAGAYGRMVVDTTSSDNNLGVSFEPAEYFLKVDNGTPTGRNIRMIQSGEHQWVTQDMWDLNGTWLSLSIKATLTTGSSFSEDDPGADIDEWSEYVLGSTIGVADSARNVKAGDKGYARITTNDSEHPNGNLEFVMRDESRHLSYDYGEYLGEEIPDQYPMGSEAFVRVLEPRLKEVYTFMGWTRKANPGESDKRYYKNDTIHLSAEETKLYAQASYDGQLQIAISFVEDGKRYFLTHPNSSAPRYARARHFDDWTNVWQGMENAENLNPDYLSTFEMRYPVNEMKAKIGDIPDLQPTERVLDPSNHTMHGSIDSLTFYEFFNPARDEFLGLYYDASLNTIVANNTWAGLFTAESAKTGNDTVWPSYITPFVNGVKLKSTRYVYEADPKDHPDELTLKERANSDAPYVQYNSTQNQFNGIAVAAAGSATTFDLSAISVADAHYVVLPDTSKVWNDTITFGYHSEPTSEELWSKLIGKQLMAVMRVGDDTVYFHPNRKKSYNTPQDMYLSTDFRLTYNVALIHDRRVSDLLGSGDSLMMQDADNAWCKNIVSGNSSPMDVKYIGEYTDIFDTVRISLTQGGISKIKEYRGRWKKGAPGLKVNATGTSRYRDVIIRTKTYHYTDTATRYLLTPEKESYTFGPSVGQEQVINFTLIRAITHWVTDKDGNKIRQELISEPDTITNLGMIPGGCRLAKGDTLTITSAHDNSVTVSVTKENTFGIVYDTLKIGQINIGETPTSIDTVRIPLKQSALEGDELIWSFVHDSKRYFIMAVKNTATEPATYSLQFREFAKRDNALYKLITQEELVKGSGEGGDNTDGKYITPWKFAYPDQAAHPEQLTLVTKYSIDKSFAIDGVRAVLGALGSPSTVTYRYAATYVNDNANYEELVRLKYGEATNKWLKVNITDGVPSSITLQEDSASATIFSWGYLIPEYNLLNNGDYPSQTEAVFGYNDAGGEDIQTLYKAYREYSTLLDSTLTYLGRVEETDPTNLTNAGKEWLTTCTIDTIRDRRLATSSGLNHTTNGTTLVTTVTPASATSPKDVKIGDEYVNIVDTLRVTLGLQAKAPAYRFKGDWSEFTSISDANLKIPLVRMTFHDNTYDSIICMVSRGQASYTFPATDAIGKEFEFKLSTLRRTGRNVVDVDDNIVEIAEATTRYITRYNPGDGSNTGMHLNNKDSAEVRLIDEYGNTPTWCEIKSKTDSTITVRCTANGIRTPRTAYIYLAYIIRNGGDLQFVNYRLSVTQVGKFSYDAMQTLQHSNGASGDEKTATGMQQVHENKRILYYYPDEDMELHLREGAFYGWCRWYREGKDVNDNDVGDTDVPDSLWVDWPTNTGKFNFPFRKIIVDSVTEGGVKKLGRTMGRYTVFHYPARDYQKGVAPINNPTVAAPTREYGKTKPILTYVADLGNYYDNLPMSLSVKNQVDINQLAKMPVITEPTLSLREIFELRPWTEMADTLEHYKYLEEGSNLTTGSTTYNRKYMEEHVLMAPTGNRLLLRTEQHYSKENVQNGQSESLLGYYTRDDNWDKAATPWSDARKDSMIWCIGWDQDCHWYTYTNQPGSYAECNNPITKDDDFLDVPSKASISAGHEFDTVYYCLRARSKKSGTAPDYLDDDEALGDYWFNICRYMVIYHNPNKYGPKYETKVKDVAKAIMTNDEIEQTYEVLEKLNFDYNKPGNDYTIYPHPLPWADASYGFMYPETPDLPHNRYHPQSDFPNNGEYGLINRIPYGDFWHKMEQHGGAANGYMIYCDGMASAGQVAALNLETTLCAGQQMYFSGYVANPSNQTGSNKARPNFTFSVQGSVNGSTWENITEYTTGNLEPKNQWLQILFPITFNAEEKEYKHFRVRIYNVAASFDGNDFIIDDMRLFATKPPLIAYQAQTKCVEIGEKDSITQVVLRVDYQGFTHDSYNNNDVYYTVQQIDKSNDTTYVSMIDAGGYINQRTGEGRQPSVFGYIHTPAKNYVPTNQDSVYSKLNSLIESVTKHNYAHKQGYVYENVNGHVRPVLYVIHEAKMTPDNEYKVRMSTAANELTSSICAMTSNLKVTNKMMLELNGEEQDSKEITNMCANTTYDISMRVKGTLYLDSVAPIDLNGSCYNDWLVGGDTARASSLARYGYYYSDIVKVVKEILRCEPNSGTNENQFAPNLASVNPNVMQRILDEDEDLKLETSHTPYQVLSNLVNNGHLILYQSKLTETVSRDSTLKFVVFPIAGTGSETMRKSEMEVCPAPIFISLHSDKGGSVPMTIGGAKDGNTAVILANTDAAAHEMTVRIDSLMATVQLDTVITLRSTNDSNYLEGVHTLNLVSDRARYAGKGATIHLRPARNNNYVMRPGFSYTFDITMLSLGGSTEGDNGCPVGNVPFTVSVVPDQLRWDPQSTTNNKWNDPDNWIGINQQNLPIHKDAHFAPLRSTSVVIPTLSEGKPYPYIPDTITSADSVHHSGFEYNKCDVIRFMPGTAIAQQQNLTCNNAVIDMTLPNQKWALRAAPVEGMLSGDVYMSEADLNWQTSPWEVGVFDASGRNYNTGNASFWLSLYSRATTNYGNGDTQETRSADAKWTKVSNGLTMPLLPAQGFAVYSRTASGKDAVVRLPKNDDTYYYYSIYGDRLDDHYINNLRSMRNADSLGNGFAGKLAFRPDGDSVEYTLKNEVASDIFIFGNPTMGYIDIWGFLADNPTLTGEIGYLEERSGNSASIYRSVTKEVAENVGTSPDAITNLRRYLPPMHVMVLKAAEGTSLTVKLYSNRIVTAPSQKAARPVSAPQRVGSNGRSRGIMTVTAINPVSTRCNSSLLLGQGYHAAILDGEDAMLTTLNIDNYTNNTTPSTPFNLYAVENDCGLSIDLRDQIQNVPLSFYMSNLPFAPTTQLWFTGVNHIDGELVLYDSYTGTERRIIDGICLDIATPEQSHEVRYYIRRRGFDPNDPTTPVATAIQPNELEDIPVMKIIRDGQVLIIRDGHIYTTLGQKLK